MSYYKTLKVNEDASQAEIKKAYKQLAQQYHPDKGGDKQTFQEITEAYQCLCNELTRTQYDNGTYNKHKRKYESTEEKAEKILIEAYVTVIQSIDPSRIKYTNIIAKIESNLKDKISTIKKSKKAATQELTKQQEILSRLSGSNELLMDITHRNISAIKQDLTAMQDNIQVIKTSIMMANDYSYRTDESKVEIDFKTLGEMMNTENINIEWNNRWT